jgi:hypothetical protein
VVERWLKFTPAGTEFNLGSPASHPGFTPGSPPTSTLFPLFFNQCGDFWIQISDLPAMDSQTAPHANDQPVYPEHTRRNQSRLEAFCRDIVAMRRANWPYAQIAGWLADEHDIRVAFQSVSKMPDEISQILENARSGLTDEQRDGIRDDMEAMFRKSVDTPRLTKTCANSFGRYRSPTGRSRARCKISPSRFIALDAHTR